MISDVLQALRCPECWSRALEHETFEQAAADGHIVDGVLWCSDCRNWYPIAGGVLELLPLSLAYNEDRDKFWNSHDHRLRAHDLRPIGATPAQSSESPEAAQQRHFDWYARNATQTYDAYERTAFWQAVDNLTFREWRKRIARGSWVLDVGCAQGRSSAGLIDCDVTIVGFDVSKALVRQAHERYARNANGARAVFFVGNASRFPFVEDSFDYVLVYGVLHHLNDPAYACAEISRVLKPGGTYFGLENNVTVLRPLFDLLQRFRPEWHEEAGAKPLMSARERTQWFAAAGIVVDAHSSVFLPPHLANCFNAGPAQRLIEMTDRVVRKVPFLRQQGGLLVATGTKTLRN